MMRDAELDSDATKSSNEWRNRDKSLELLNRWGISTKIAAKGSETAPLSAHFGVGACLARIRRDRAPVVRAAFNAAATAVVQGVASRKSLENESLGAPGAIPELAKSWKQLESLRVKSLDRAFDNKEARKIKGPADLGSSSKVNKSRESSENAKIKSSALNDTGQGSTDQAKASSRAPTSSTAVSQIMTPSIDSRSTVSHAILCSAAAIAFDTLTPVLPGHEVSAVDVPQNNESNAATVNMGAVSLQAQTLGQRAASLAQNAALRSQQRYEYRRDNARYQDRKRNRPFELKNPFSWKNDECSTESNESDLISEPDDLQLSVAQSDSITDAWKDTCFPRLVSILREGSGHAVICDLDWTSRHGRVSSLLRHLVSDNDYGPHLIVTTQPEVNRFRREFDALDRHVRLLPNHEGSMALRVLTYTGTKQKRRMLRKHFSGASGLPGSDFHVLVTSYSVFLEDFLHLCQIPYQVALLDDGLSWLSSSQSDPNCSLAALWANGVWSSSDQHIGLAGTSHQTWDFYSDKPEENGKNACIGLTVRYRIVTSRSMTMKHRGSLQYAPVACLVSFLLPHFADVVREEWDRSRIVNDKESMSHIRKLIARSVVVHSAVHNSSYPDFYDLILDVMLGKVAATRESAESSEKIPSLIPDETFVSSGKVSQSRRLALLWLGSPATSWLRYELGSTSFEPALEAMKRSSAHGHVCEEIVTASSMTSSGAGGTVSGSQAYRLAVRCGRHFGSEQGLRQHMAALHAPPGTWLCRTCGGDCGTSQARTHHERTCGQPSGGSCAHGGPAGGGVSTVGQGVRPNGGKQHGPAGLVVMKGKSRAADGLTGAGPEDKDKDGSFRVPGYRGVWVNTAGKHFIKIDGKSFTSEDDDVLLFDAIEEAARKYDDVVKSGKSSQELNFRSDGTRIIYDDSTAAAAAAAGRGLEMLGGSASSVVPALSVINIKDLPPGVKPLLRDPRATSRTGGNSKRHVYAYRGVCRQARKGHDRWQSQISFSGTNHYLGTFDSEWDAAAIYAWAHLILYGEEATKKAQKEGEEAAAAYEQEKKDIAAGRIVVSPKPAKKKAQRKKEKKQAARGAEPDGKDAASKKKKVETSGDALSGKRPLPQSSIETEKRTKLVGKAVGKTDTMSIAQVLAKGVGKATVLAPRKIFIHSSDADLFEIASQRISAARRQALQSYASKPPPVDNSLRPCAPMPPSSEDTPSGNAMLLGLSATLFAWSVETFVSTCSFDNVGLADVVFASLEEEYKRGGVNESFRTVVQGSICMIGCASEQLSRASKSLRLGEVTLGGTIGNLDCHVGGVSGSCSEAAALITHGETGFSFSCCSTIDIVTLNGMRVTEEMGSFPLVNEDVCTVGPRVFVFLLPMDT